MKEQYLSHSGVGRRTRGHTLVLVEGLVAEDLQQLNEDNAIFEVPLQDRDGHVSSGDVVIHPAREGLNHCISFLVCCSLLPCYTTLSGISLLYMYCY